MGILCALYGLGVLLSCCGCAGTQTVGPIEPGQLEGRAVDMITLHDGREVWFDPWDTAQPGRDKRARVRGDGVEGYVGGVFRRYPLEDIQSLGPGTSDSARTKWAVGTTALVVLVGLVALLFTTLLYDFPPGL